VTGLFVSYDMEVVEKFYQVLSKKVSITEFEQWVYSTPELEAVLSEGDYLALISLNYKERWTLHELQKIISGYIDWSEIRRQELLEALQTIVRRGVADDVLGAFSLTYHWYCRGYSFLQDIAFSFLSADNDFLYDPQGEWTKLTESQKQQYINSFYPQARKLAEQLIQQLETGQIQLHILGPEDAVTYTEASVTSSTKDSEPIKTEFPVVKKWWQFWK
jgi:hypothetical protein